MKKYIFTVLIFNLIGCLSFGQGYSGLIAHWDFNGSANDVSGHGLNGVVTGATLDTGYLGIPNTAYHFNGSGDHIDVPYDSLMNIDSTFSICVFIKPMGFYSGDCQGNFILTRGVEYSSDYYMVGYDDGAYDLSCSIATPDHQIFYSSVPGGSDIALWYPGNILIVTNTWYCVVLSYTGDTINLYVDGVKLESLAMHKDYVPGTDGIGIGYNTTRASDFPFWVNGVIDDIRLYNRSLSDAEAVQYCDSVHTPTFVNSPHGVSSEISISPNPTTSNLTITSPQLITQITINNLIGQVIFTNYYQKQEVQVDVSNLPNGMYFVTVNGAEVKKFIKQ